MATLCSQSDGFFSLKIPFLFIIYDKPICLVHVMCKKLARGSFFIVFTGCMICTRESARGITEAVSFMLCLPQVFLLPPRCPSPAKISLCCHIWFQLLFRMRVYVCICGHGCWNHAWNVRKRVLAGKLHGSSQDETAGLAVFLFLHQSVQEELKEKLMVSLYNVISYTHMS